MFEILLLNINKNKTFKNKHQSFSAQYALELTTNAIYKSKFIKKKKHESFSISQTKRRTR
jgi:hypothetical protein